MSTDATSTDTTEPPEGFRQWRYEPPPGATTVLLVRHGESAAAFGDQPFPLRDGHGDPALHPDGELQARRLGARLAAEHEAGGRIDAIYVTTLQRTAQTAAPLATRIGVEPAVEADLREVFLGEWEGGLLRKKAAEGDPVLQQVFATERWDAIPGAEPLEDFDARLTRRDRPHHGGASRSTSRRREPRRCDRAPPARGDSIVPLRVLRRGQRVGQRDGRRRRALVAPPVQRHLAPGLTAPPGRAAGRSGGRPVVLGASTGRTSVTSPDQFAFGRDATWPRQSKTARARRRRR